jgi:hypothetical protein
MASGEPKQGIHPAESTPKTRTEGKKETLMNPLLPETTSRASAMERPSIRNEFQVGKEQSITVSKGETPTAVKPVHIFKVQPPQSGTIKAMPRQAVSHVRKAPMYKQKSIGLVELTLKLLSIALSCLVILFLHRANKTATNRYEALLQP